MRSAIATLLLSLCITGTASTQTYFRAELNGAQEVGPTGSTGTGVGEVILNPLTNQITVELSVTGLTPPITAAHIHVGVLGANGANIVTLPGTGPTWSHTATLTAGQVALLQANGLYLNVHTLAFPGGEVRGQLTSSDRRFDAYLTGAKEVGPVATPATAIATCVLNANNTVTYSVTSTGLIGAPTAGHIHEGVVGVNGPNIFTLIHQGGGAFSGTTAALSDLQVAKLRSGNFYINVHTTTFPGGEIRGQIVPSFTQHGDGCPGTPGIPVLDGSGAPVPGGTFTIDVTNGLGSGAGALLFSGFADEFPVIQCTLNVAAFPVLLSFPLNLPPSGNLSLPITLTPPVTPGWLHTQWAGLDAGGVGGLSMSNGMGFQLNI